MTFDEYMDAIRTLASQQGYYARLLSRIETLEATDPVMYEDFVNQITNMAKDFTDIIDIIMYYES